MINWPIFTEFKDNYCAIQYYETLTNSNRHIYIWKLQVLCKLVNLQLFVGGLTSYLRYFCLLAYSGVQHILCCDFFYLSCIPYVASFSWLSLRYSLTFIFNTRFFQTQTLIKSVRHWQVSGRVIVVQRKRSNVLPMFHVYQDDVRFVLYHLQCFISVILVIN
jgi:hypothetical protein